MKKLSCFLISVLLSITLLVGCQEKSNSLSSDNNSGQVSNKTSPDHFDTIIGQVINGNFVLVANINEKVSDWEDAINTGSSLNLSFDNVTIEINDGKYFLTGVDESADATSRIKLILSSGNFYEAKFQGGEVGSSSQGYGCTCSGCTSTGSGSAGECSPKENEDGWYCTSCSQGTCTKTISAVNGGIISR